MITWNSLVLTDLVELWVDFKDVDNDGDYEEVDSSSWASTTRILTSSCCSRIDGMVEWELVGELISEWAGWFLSLVYHPATMSAKLTVPGMDWRGFVWVSFGLDNRL